MEIFRLRACRWWAQPFCLCPACDRSSAYCYLPYRWASPDEGLASHVVRPHGRLDDYGVVELAAAAEAVLDGTPAGRAPWRTTWSSADGRSDNSRRSLRCCRRIPASGTCTSPRMPWRPTIPSFLPSPPPTLADGFRRLGLRQTATDLTDSRSSATGRSASYVS